MGKMSRKRVAVQELSSKYKEHLCVFRIESGFKFGEFSGMVPETLRIPSRDILGQCDEDPISSICKCQNLFCSICSAR